eukprot:TRINITY_DN2258_c0_g1_i1.p1 TRINITY_DN2258_c0_g1~~TRINITY_DN2258_c0_g1_i1.p1  ORF type:complete len:609 (+),score=236.89 TRINITY_DN2258_c0_g1_i1:1942-3768(+)
MAASYGDEVDYYALLNVPRTASATEISAAFRKLSRIYHPDRVQQRNPELITQAQEKFQLLSEAHAVLTDDYTRQLYNTYGVAGVKAGKQLANRYKSPEEFRREFDKLRRRDELAQLDRLQNTHGVMTINLSIADMFPTQHQQRPSISGTGLPRYLPPRRRSYWPQLRALSLAQAYEMQFSERTSCTFSGTLGQQRHSAAAAAGWGGGGMSAVGQLQLGVQHHLSPLTRASFNLATSGDTAAVQVGSWRRLGQYTQASMSLLLHRLGSSLELDLQRQLTRNTQAAWACTVGQQASMRVRVTHHFDEHLAAVVGELRQDEQQLSAALNVTRQLSPKTTLKLGGRVGTAHSEFTLGASRRPSKHSLNSIGMFLACSPMGISYKFSFARGSQKVVVPVLVTPELSLRSLSWAVMVPAVLFLFTKLLVLEPRRLRKKLRKQQERRRANRDAVAKAKQAADDDLSIYLKGIDLQIKMEVEEARRGLVVLDGKFGPASDLQTELGREQPSAPSSPSAAAAELPTAAEPLTALDAADAIRVADITTPLQLLVDDSKLLVEVSTLTHHTGIWDPAPGEPKQLYIKYLFKDRVHEAFFEEDDEVSIPQKSHLLNSPPS